MVRRSAPFSSKCVAKQWRRVWGWIRFCRPARWAAFWQAYHTVFGVMGRGAVWQGPPGNNQSVGLRFKPRQVVAQSFQQDGTEHDISVLTAFPAADVDDHSSAVDIGDLQASQLGAPYPGAIEGHQHNAMKSSLGLQTARLRHAQAPAARRLRSRVLVGRVVVDR